MHLRVLFAVILQITLPQLLWAATFDIVDFGATGNDETDDTVAVSKLVAHGVALSD